MEKITGSEMKKKMMQEFTKNYDINKMSEINKAVYKSKVEKAKKEMQDGRSN